MEKWVGHLKWVFFLLCTFTTIQVVVLPPSVKGICLTAEKVLCLGFITLGATFPNDLSRMSGVTIILRHGSSRVTSSTAWLSPKADNDLMPFPQRVNVSLSNRHGGVTCSACVGRPNPHEAKSVLCMRFSRPNNFQLFITWVKSLKHDLRWQLKQ